MDSEATTGHNELRGSLRVILAVLAILAAINSCIFIWVVPRADEAHQSIFGSLGYVIAFLTLFVDFLFCLGLAAYYFKNQSYPSDRWQ